MKVYKNLFLIGTSHIAKESIEEVERIINKEKPQAVALELDKARFHALLNNIKGRIKLENIKQIGLKGYIFAKVGEYAEKKLGGIVGVNPGSEMLKAAEVAKKNNYKIELIDQKIEITLKKFSKEVKWFEKFKMVFDSLKQLIKKEKIKFDLTKVPEKELILKLLKQVKERYPNMYKVLVSDRNKFMARKLFILMRQHEKIIAVVGAGHENEIIEEIKKIENAN